MENDNTSSNEYLDCDNIGLRNSPPPKPIKVGLQPPPDSPKPSPSDTVLVSFINGKRHENVARAAGEKLLALDDETEEEETEGNAKINSIRLAILAAKALNTRLDITSASSITTYKDNDPSAPINLPSISEQLGDINQLPKAASARGSILLELTLVGLSSIASNLSRQLPLPHSNPIDHSKRSKMTSSMDLPSPASTIDRMSIEGTNLKIGGFRCIHPGCTSHPFQNRCLLTSHAQVHSSERPYCCNVQGCQSKEGFKRKSDLIRHGLVHDSPGYVCPFRHDREHKYLRSDNLIRHVRDQHPERIKDPELMEVLSQRSSQRLGRAKKGKS